MTQLTATEILQRLDLLETATTFDQFVVQWSQIKSAAKILSDLEMKMRKAIAASAFPNPVEGTNNLTSPEGRQVKLVHKISRTVDESQIALARSEYILLNDRPVEFDDLLKVKYDLVTSAYKKLEPSTPPFLTVARMLTVKAGAPTITVG